MDTFVFDPQVGASKHEAQGNDARNDLLGR